MGEPLVPPQRVGTELRFEPVYLIGFRRGGAMPEAAMRNIALEDVGFANGHRRSRWCSRTSPEATNVVPKPAIIYADGSSNISFSE